MMSIDQLTFASLQGKTLDPGSSLVIAEWTAEANSKDQEIAPRHIHDEDDEIWYVLDGALGFDFDGDRIVIESGGCAIAPAGVAHTYWNAHDRETRYLLITTRRIHDLISTLHDADKRGGRSFAQVFEDHASRIL